MYAVSSIQPLDRTQSGTTTPRPSGPKSNGDEGILRIPQSSSITGTSSIGLFNVISGTLVGGGLTPLQRSSPCILQPHRILSIGACSVIIIVVVNF